MFGKIKKITVLPGRVAEGVSSGRVNWEMDLGNYLGYTRVIVTLTGPCAEARASHRSLSKEILGEGSGDWGVAIEETQEVMNFLCQNYTGEDIAKVVHKAGEVARQIVRGAWPAVVALGDTLREHHTISGKKAESIIKKALRISK
jgi:hypothetical protein